MRSKSVTRQVTFNRTKIGGKCQNSKIQMRHFGWFSNTVNTSSITYMKHDVYEFLFLLSASYNDTKGLFLELISRMKDDRKVSEESLTFPISHQKYVWYFRVRKTWKIDAFDDGPLVSFIAAKAWNHYTFFALTHGVWKSQKKSHSTLRAKRATITFEWTKVN